MVVPELLISLIVSSMTGVSKREGLEGAVASLSLVKAEVKAEELESSVEGCCSSDGISLASSVSLKRPIL